MRRSALALLLIGCVPSGGFDAGTMERDAGMEIDAGVDAGLVGGWLMVVYAGTGAPGSGDGPAASAQFNQPTGLALDAQGNLYVADTGNRTIRKIDSNQVVSTLAGQSPTAFVDPRGVAVDRRGNVYVSDTQEQCVKVIEPSNRVRTFAGTCRMGMVGFSRCYDSTAGTVGPGDIAGPAGLAVDEDAGIVYIADAEHQLIRFAAMTGRELGTLAGRADSMGYRDGACGRSFCCGSSFNLPGCTAMQATVFRNPYGLALAPSSELLISDRGNCLIRKISTPAAAACRSSTVFGTECQGGLPLDQTLNAPLGVAAGEGGLIYVSDTSNQRVVLIDPSMPSLSRLNVISKPGEVVAPAGIAVDGPGRVFVADSASNRILMFLPP